MKLKIDPTTGKAEVKDGMPVYVGDDGAETTYDLPKLLASVGATRDERDRFQREAKAAADALRQFGTTDDEIKAAVEKLKLARGLDDKKLVDAKGVDEVVQGRLAEATKAWQEEKANLERAAAEANAKVRQFLISGRLRSSKVLEEYLSTPDLIELALGQHFDVDGDQVVAFRDPTKKDRIYSAKDPGKPADVDEALAILLKSHPNHDKWKKSSNASGSGASAAPNAPGSGHTITREEARDPQRYRAAREAADKAGVSLQIAN